MKSLGALHRLSARRCVRCDAGYITGMAVDDRAQHDLPTFVRDARDEERARALARTKAIAAGVLAASVVVLVFARVMQRDYPAFSYLAAFAEAATIGGLADWFAVVALFRRPLGLPIPHTAIIPQNQARIAEKLGTFIETHFLAAGPVAAKLRDVDFARFIADWLGDTKRSGDLARYLLRLAPELLSALEQSGLKTFATRKLLMQLDAVDIGSLAAGVLKGVVSDGRHQRLLDDLLGALTTLIHAPDTLAALGAKIRDELPSLLRLYRADTFLLKRIVASVSTFLDEVRDDPNHAFRSEFDRFLHAFIDDLATSPDYEARLNTLKRGLLARPEFAALATQGWSMLRGFVDDAAQGAGPLPARLQRVLAETGAHLAADADLRAEINSGMIVVLSSFIESQKSGVSTFIADQVKSWDIDQLVTLIEINIGRDLQYIRFNGALIGGVAGLLLHAGEQFLRLN